MNNTQLLTALAGALGSGGIKLIDLTQTLTPDFPQIALPPEMGQCWPFRIEEVSRYDERVHTSMRRFIGFRVVTWRKMRLIRFQFKILSRLHV